jgi:hypothetical protein
VDRLLVNEKGKLGQKQMRLTAGEQITAGKRRYGQ